MKILRGSVNKIGSLICFFIALCFAYPSATYSVGYSGSGGIRSLSPSSTDGITEELKPYKSIEEIKAFELTEDLNPQEVVGRLNAALALGKMKGPKAVKPLIALLRNSPLAVVRFVAATALGEIGDPRAMKPLIVALKDKDSTGGVQVAAAIALAKIMDTRAVDPLVASLEDENPDVRAGAANALGILGDPTAVLPLIAALGDENPFVRFHAARALGQLKHPLAVTPLVSSLTEDRVSEVRWWAAHALGEIKDSRAIEPLADAIEITGRRPMAPYTDVIEVGDSLRAKKNSLAELIKDMHWSIQLEAIRSLGKIGEEALPALIATLSKHQDLDFRTEAAREIIDIKCAQFMIEVLKRDHLLEVVKEIYAQVIATGEFGTEEVLIEALSAYGGINMARDFLESNNEKLEKAAEIWMKREGYESLPSKPKVGPRWGEDPKEDCQTLPEIAEE